MKVCLAAGLLFWAISAHPQQTTVQAAVRPAAERPPAPLFQLRDGSGTPVSLADMRGTPVILNLWATACGGCQKELPTFVELDHTYRHRGLRVVGVSMDVMYESLKSSSEGWAKVTPFAEAHSLRYLILLDDGSVEKAYNVTAMPATYLIDKRGRIAATYIGIVNGANLAANVAKLLAE